MNKSNKNKKEDISFFPSKVYDHHAMLVPEEEFRRLSQNTNLIKDLQKIVTRDLDRFREDATDKAPAVRLARYTILALESAIKLLQQIRCHVPDETFLNEVFIPFLQLHDLMGEIRSLRCQCTNWPEKERTYPFTQFSRDSALDTAIAFAEEIYNSAKNAAQHLEMLNEQGVFDSLTVQNICWVSLNVGVKTPQGYAIGSKPQRRFIDWQSLVKEALDRVPLDHVDQDRQKLIDMINGELELSPSGKKHRRRKTRMKKTQKFGFIIEYLSKNPGASNKEISNATGIHQSDVSRLLKEIPAAAKSSRSVTTLDQEDKSALCDICHSPKKPFFWCEMCNQSIRDQCKECHFTNVHPEHAQP